MRIPNLCGNVKIDSVTYGVSYEMTSSQLKAFCVFDQLASVASFQRYSKPTSYSAGVDAEILILGSLVVVDDVASGLSRDSVTGCELEL